MSEAVTTHLREHVEKWPASRDDILSACNNVSDIPEKERRWLVENLPEGVYRNPDEAELILQRGPVQG